MADWQWYSREAQHFKREVTDPFFDALNEGAEKKVVNYLEKHRRPVNKLWEWDGEECWEYDIQVCPSKMAYTSKDKFFQALSQGNLDRVKTLLDRRMDVDAVLEVKQIYKDENGEEQLLTLMEYYRKMTKGSALYHSQYKFGADIQHNVT